jgi:hypothetical protein
VLESLKNSFVWIPIRSSEKFPHATSTLPRVQLIPIRDIVTFPEVLAFFSTFQNFSPLDLVFSL